MTKPSPIRIGTRASVLALFQANEVKTLLEQKSLTTEIIKIASEGDIDLETPLYEMGIQGIFTKTLDAALLQNRIDVAVHSAKDIPTRLAKGLLLGAVLERGPVLDSLVLPAGIQHIDLTNPCMIATSSLRRKNQWLHRYPNHTFESLRGNIQTRLTKLETKGWHGAIFAHAALHRLAIDSHHIIPLEWMLPAPAQGAIAIVCREQDAVTREFLKTIHHHASGVCIHVERDFLAALHGGCSVPIAAHAEFQNGQLSFRGNIMSLDARQKCDVEIQFEADQVEQAGYLASREILKRGGAEIIKSFRPL